MTAPYVFRRIFIKISQKLQLFQKTVSMFEYLVVIRDTQCKQQQQ